MHDQSKIDQFDGQFHEAADKLFKALEFASSDESCGETIEAFGRAVTLARKLIAADAKIREHGGAGYESRDEVVSIALDEAEKILRVAVVTAIAARSELDAQEIVIEGIDAAGDRLAASGIRDNSLSEIMDDIEDDHPHIVPIFEQIEAMQPQDRTN